MLKREFKINFKSLIIWVSILITFFLVIFLVYPSIMSSTSSQSIKEMMKIFPEEMLKTFNMDIVGIESVFGWLKTEGYMFISLIGGVYAAILGGTILIKEENDKTIEFLYSKPISRSKIVTSKIICGIINIAIFTAIITIFNLVGLYLSNDLELKQYLLISITPLILYYMLFFISLFVSTLFKKTKQGMSIALAITFISYLMQILGGMGEKVEWIKNISLFEFASVRYVILNNHLNYGYIAIGLGIIAICIAGTYYRYNKKELV